MTRATVGLSNRVSWTAGQASSGTQRVKRPGTRHQVRAATRRLLHSALPSGRSSGRGKSSLPGRNRQAEEAQAGEGSTSRRRQRLQHAGVKAACWRLKVSGISRCVRLNRSARDRLPTTCRDVKRVAASRSKEVYCLKYASGHDYSSPRLLVKKLRLRVFRGPPL